MIYGIFTALGSILLIFGLYCLYMNRVGPEPAYMGCFGIISVVAGPLLLISGVISAFSNGKIFAGIIAILIPIALGFGVYYLLKMYK